jgi:hypothetical protein
VAGVFRVVIPRLGAGLRENDQVTMGRADGRRRRLSLPALSRMRGRPTRRVVASSCIRTGTQCRQSRTMCCAVSTGSLVWTLDRLRKPGQPVTAADQDVTRSPVAQLGKHRQPELHQTLPAPQGAATCWNERLVRCGTRPRRLRPLRNPCPPSEPSRQPGPAPSTRPRSDRGRTRSPP